MTKHKETHLSRFQRELASHDVHPNLPSASPFTSPLYLLLSAMWFRPPERHALSRSSDSVSLSDVKCMSWNVAGVVFRVMRSDSLDEEDEWDGQSTRKPCQTHTFVRILIQSELLHTWTWVIVMKTSSRRGLGKLCIIILQFVTVAV